MIRLNPCFIVLPGLMHRGGVSYKTMDKAQWEEGSEEHAQWTTKKRIANPQEYNDAKALKSRSERKIEACGAAHPLGVLIPVDRLQDYEQAREEITQDLEVFNGTAQTCQVSFTPAIFEIESTKEDVVRGLVDTLAQQLTDLQGALERRDFKEVRDILGQSFGGKRGQSAYRELLQGSGYGYKLQSALDTARTEARRLARQAREYGEQYDLLQARVDTSPIDVARAAFVGALEDSGEAVEAPAVDLSRAATTRTEEEETEKEPARSPIVERPLFMFDFDDEATNAQN